MTSPRTSVELRTRHQVRSREQDPRALIKRIANGDESAFATLYNMTSGLIFGLLLRDLGNSGVAEEVWADFYKELREQAAAYDDRREEAMTWLITTARRRALARLKAGRQSQQREARLHAAPVDVLTAKEISTMADQKDKAKEKKKQEESGNGERDDEQASGYGSSGGNMGAGRSGKENLGSEKPSDEEGMGSQKPSDRSGSEKSGDSGARQ